MANFVSIYVVLKLCRFWRPMSWILLLPFSGLSVAEGVLLPCLSIPSDASADVPSDAASDAPQDPLHNLSINRHDN